jgi:hypothetical protein
MILPEKPDALGRMHVGDNAVDVARGVRAKIVDGDLLGPVSLDVVFDRVGGENCQLAPVMCLDILWVGRGLFRAGPTPHL